MKAEDILILLKIHVWQYGKWSIRKIAQSIYYNKSSVERSLSRMKKVHLFNPVTQKVNTKNLEEFLFYGLPYVFPASIGNSASGIPTAYSAPPLKQQLVSGDKYIVVWSYEGKNIKGKAINPLCDLVPKAVLTDNQLYELFCLIDALRIGRKRDITLARKEISKRLKHQ